MTASFNVSFRKWHSLYKMNNLSSERRVCIIVVFTISFSWEKDYTQSEQSWREGPGLISKLCFLQFFKRKLYLPAALWCDNVTFGFIFLVFTSSSFDIIDLCKKFYANPHQLNGLQSLKAAEIFSLILLPMKWQSDRFQCVCLCDLNCNGWWKII